MNAAPNKSVFDYLSTIVLCAGIAVSLASYFMIRDYEREVQSRSLQEEAQQIRAEASEKLSNLSSLVLATGALFKSSQNVTQSEWDSFLATVKSSQPEYLLGLAFIEHGKARGQRHGTESCSVLYSQSKLTSTLLPGSDLCQHRDFFPLIQKAELSGEMIAGYSENTADELGSHKSLIIVFPVVKPEHLGWVVLISDAESLFSTIQYNNHIEHLIFSDLTGSGEPSALFSIHEHQGRAADYSATDSSHVIAEQQFSFADRTYSITLSVDKTYGSISLLIAIAGSIVSIMIYLALHTMAKTRAKAIEIADDMTAALRDSQERYDLAVRGTSDGIWDWDMTSNHVWYSPRYMEMLGYTEEEHPPTLESFTRLCHPDDVEATFKAVDAHVRHREPYDVEFRMRHQSGEYRWMRSRGKVITDETGQPLRMAGFHTDITEMKRVQQELQQAMDDAKASATAKSDFLANMSHEIRTPLNGIIGICELMQQTALSGKQDEYLQIMESSSKSLLEIVNDILDLSKLESGRMEIEEIGFDLYRLAKDLIELMRPRLRSEHVELIFRYQQDLPNRFVSDPTRIRQVLLNLISNAIKFTEHGYVYLGIEGHLTRNRLWNITLRVEDTGIGIPQDKVEQVFEKFSQGDSSTTRKYGGTGLGLAITRQISELLGGHVKVQSQVSRGSHFSVELPMLADQSQPHKIPKLPEFQGLHMLVVDDEQINQQILVELLTPMGVRVDVAYTSQQAIAMLHESIERRMTYDMAILDFFLPDKNGGELAVAIHDIPHYAKLPLILLTSTMRKGHAIEMRNCGFSAYLLKPVFHELLIETIATVLSAHSENSEEDVWVTRHSIAEAKLIEDRPSQRPLEGMRILVAEDNPTNQRVISWMLDDMGASYSIECNGRLAVEQFANDPFDLVLMDCQMPEMDGFEATSHIRSMNLGGREHTPIIAITAFAMESDEKRCIAAGMNGYISKPITREKLLMAIAAIHQKPQSRPTKKAATDVVADWAYLRALTGQSPEKLRALYDLFCASFSQHSGLLAAALTRGDFEAAQREAHDLKGLCANMQATALKDTISLIEKQLRIDQTAVSEMDIARLAKQFSHFQEAFEREIQLANYEAAGGSGGI